MLGVRKSIAFWLGLHVMGALVCVVGAAVYLLAVDRVGQRPIEYDLLGIRKGIHSISASVRRDGILNLMYNTRRQRLTTSEEYVDRFYLAFPSQSVPLFKIWAPSGYGLTATGEPIWEYTNVQIWWYTFVLTGMAVGSAPLLSRRYWSVWLLARGRRVTWSWRRQMVRGFEVSR